MPTYLATDHQTRFVVSHKGKYLNVQYMHVVDDLNGGMDFAWRTFATYALTKVIRGRNKEFIQYSRTPRRKKP